MATSALSSELSAGSDSLLSNLTVCISGLLSLDGGRSLDKDPGDGMPNKTLGQERDQRESIEAVGEENILLFYFIF